MLLCENLKFATFRRRKDIRGDEVEEVKGWEIERFYSLIVLRPRRQEFQFPPHICSP